MSARWQWRAWVAVPWVIALSALVCWWLGHYWFVPRDAPPAPLPSPDAAVSLRTSVPAATNPSTGEAHSLAMSDLVARTNANEQLTPTDTQSLLAFISSPKPGDLTDGEWEERVNGVLNLLRRQEVSSGQFQVSSGEGAGSLASSLATSGPASLGAAGPPRPTVPGLTEVLLEMAERNGSKVLRLYAMQHLSLWFGKEGDPGKRRAMVGLLEKLATTPGEETAGCAVMMLGDMRRQETEDLETEDGRQKGAGSLAASLAVDGHRPPLQGDGIDWGRVDEVLERAGRRLIGDAGAGADVRISAIHACVDRKDAGALAELRKIAADASLVSTLRKVAIHAIGQLGTADDLSLLDSLPKDDDNLSQAVAPARNAITRRAHAPAK